MGEDAQLDAAIAYLLRRIEESPVPVPPAPPYPDKRHLGAPSTSAPSAATGRQ
jgi:hypothetical protein